MLTQILVRVVVGGTSGMNIFLASYWWLGDSHCGRDGEGVRAQCLAFPAIFPASATLIEQREKRRKRGTGGHGTLRGRRAAALDAAGASIGAFGLLTFACLAWKLMPDLSPWATLSIATLGWLYH